MAGRKKRNGGCGCGGMCGNPKCRNPSLNVRNPSVHTGSEDYRIGLFQGAIEKGRIPPPHNTSADLRRGYADGAKVAKAKPTMVAEALGVYKATSNQQQAGAVLYNEVKGESVATLRNPSLNVRRNPSYDETKRMRKIKKMAAKGEVKDWILTDMKGTWERDIRKLILQTQEDPAFVAKIKDMGLTQAKVDEQIAFKIRLDALRAMLNYAKKTRNPSQGTARLLTQTQLEQLVNEAQARFPANDHLTVAEWMAYLNNADMIEKVGDKYRLSSKITQEDVRDALYASGGHHLYSNPSLAARRNPTVKEHSVRGRDRIKLVQSQLAWAKEQADAGERKRGIAQAMLAAGMAESDLWDGTPEKDHIYVERLQGMISGIGRELSRNPSLNVRNPSLNVRNPMSAAARKHLAHEKSEEKAFASMMSALAEGVTVKVGAHRIRKLSKGYVVVDGERLTTTQAAAKLHRGK